MRHSLGRDWLLGDGAQHRLSTQKGTPTPNPKTIENPTFGDSCPVRGPSGARIRARLVARCRLSAPQTNSSPISPPSGKSGARVGVPFERSASPPREPRIPRNCRVVLPFHPSLAGLQALLDEVSMEPCVAQSGCRVRLCIPFASRSKPLGVGRRVALFFVGLILLSIDPRLRVHEPSAARHIVQQSQPAASFYVSWKLPVV